MKKYSLLTVIALLLFGCNKQPCTPPDTEGIVGKWKLAEVFNLAIDEKEYYVTFDSTGRVYASDFPCAGTYIFDEVPRHHPDTTNLTVTFDCDPSYRAQYSITAKASARFLDNNTLALSFISCYEGCGVDYERVCD